MSDSTWGTDRIDPIRAGGEKKDDASFTWCRVMSFPGGWADLGETVGGGAADWPVDDDDDDAGSLVLDWCRLTFCQMVEMHLVGHDAGDAADLSGDAMRCDAMIIERCFCPVRKSDAFSRPLPLRDATRRMAATGGRTVAAAAAAAPIPVSAPPPLSP